MRSLPGSSRRDKSPGWRKRRPLSAALGEHERRPRPPTAAPAEESGHRAAAHGRRSGVPTQRPSKQCYPPDSTGHFRAAFSKKAVTSSISAPPDAMRVISSYASSDSKAGTHPLIVRKTHAAANPVRLLPSTNGWFLMINQQYAAAFSASVENRSYPTMPAAGIAAHESSAPESRRPSAPPHRFMAESWSFRMSSALRCWNVGSLRTSIDQPAHQVVVLHRNQLECALDRNRGPYYRSSGADRGRSPIGTLVRLLFAPDWA